MTVDTRDIREGLFRFGQWFSKANRKFVFYRDPIGNLICEGVVDDAMSKGFDVVKPGTEDLLNWNTEYQKVSIDHYDEFLQTIYFQRRDGKALQSFMQKDNVLVNFAGAEGQYYLVKDEVAQAISGWFQINIIGFTGHKRQTLNAEEDNFMELIIRRKDRVGEGLSELEPLWDVLFAIYMLVSHSAYFVARAGAGLKKATLPETAFTDAGNSDVLSTLVSTMSSFGSAGDTILLPKQLGGVDIDFSIETVDTPMDFSRLLDMYLTVISAHTGIPMSALKGIVPGQLSGATVNEESYFDFQRDLQAKYVQYCKWYVRQLNKFYKFNEADEDFDILYRVRKVMSEAEELALDKVRLETVKQWKDLGLTTIEAFKKAGIIDITDAMLREGIDEPLDLTSDEEEDGDEDEDNKEETEEDIDE